MTIKKQSDQGTTQKQRDPDFVGAEIAMHRAAKRARRRAMETIGAVAVFRDGKVVWEKTDQTFDEKATSSRPVSSGIEIDYD